MGVASNYASAAGLFATSQRGALTPAEIREIEAHRAKERPTPWQALAVRYGRCEADIKALFQTPANDDQGALPVAVESELTQAERIKGGAFWNERRTKLLRTLFCEYELDPEVVANRLKCSTTVVRAQIWNLGLVRGRVS